MRLSQHLHIVDMSATNKIDYFQNLSENVSLAIAEDIGSGDITAQLVPKEQNVTATVITRENAVVCGRPWFDEVFRQIDDTVSIKWLVQEGGIVITDQKLLELSGNARSILTAERCALNFLQTLMATATTANSYAQTLEDSPTKILDTRKTIPGLRLAQKYAVAIGGCENHRIGLYDAFLIKENHIEACGSIESAIAKARKISPSAPVEIEVETLEELRQSIDAGADRVMLDNFSISDIEIASAMKTGSVEYEISGNITDKKLSALSKLGVDYISSGAITKNIKAIDLSMRLMRSA